MRALCVRVCARASQITGRLRALNRLADIVPCTRAAVPLDRLLGLRAFDLARSACFLCVCVCVRAHAIRRCARQASRRPINMRDMWIYTGNHKYIHHLYYIYILYANIYTYIKDIHFIKYAPTMR